MNKFTVKVGKFSYAEENGIFDLRYEGKDVSGLDMNKIWREEIQNKREEIQRVIKTVESLVGVFQMFWYLEDIGLSYDGRTFCWNGVQGNSKDTFLDNMRTVFYENEHRYDKDMSDLEQLHEAIAQFKKLQNRRIKMIERILELQTKVFDVALASAVIFMGIMFIYALV